MNNTTGFGGGFPRQSVFGANKSPVQMPTYEENANEFGGMPYKAPEVGSMPTAPVQVIPTATFTPRVEAPTAASNNSTNGFNSAQRFPSQAPISHFGQQPSGFGTSQAAFGGQPGLSQFGNNNMQTQSSASQQSARSPVYNKPLSSVSPVVTPQVHQSNSRTLPQVPEVNPADVSRMIQMSNTAPKNNGLTHQPPQIGAIDNEKIDQLLHQMEAINFFNQGLTNILADTCKKFLEFSENYKQYNNRS